MKRISLDREWLLVPLFSLVSLSSAAAADQPYVINYDDVNNAFKMDEGKLVPSFPIIQSSGDKVLSDLAANPDYENQKSGILLTIKKDGKVEHEMFGWVQKESYGWKIQPEARKGRDEGMVAKPGKYVAEYQVMGASEPYSRLQFEILEFKDPNPLAEGASTLFVKGEWEGLVYLTGAKPDDRVDMGIMLNRSQDPGKDEAVVDAVLMKDGKSFARWGRYDSERKGFPVSVDFDYTNRSERFIKLSDNESEVEMKDLKDGKYSVQVKVDGRLRGTFPFEVKGGYFALSGRQDRAHHKDLKTLIYSAEKRNWFEASK